MAKWFTISCEKEKAIPVHHSISFIHALLLGILQGLTEFLPVSSTAHMAVIPQLLHKGDPGATFSAIAQLGPIIAIIVYFREDLVRYAKGIVRTKSPAKIPADDLDARLGWYTLLGTIPIVIFGKLLDNQIHTTFRRLDVIAWSLIVLALVLVVAEKVGKKNRDLASLDMADSQKIGLAQALALVPGVSRSGITITAGLFVGLTRESAARFSFLLSIPSITLAGLYELYKAVKQYGVGGDAAKDVAAAVVAGIVAFGVIYWFLRYMKEHSTLGFIIYRIALGVLILVLLSTHYLTNQIPG